MCKHHPVGLRPPSETFCKQAENSLSNAIGALLFGKYAGGGKQLASLKRIDVQSTATARRMAALGA